MSQTNGSPTTIRRRNPRVQGNIGVAAALGYFMSQGYDIAIPLGESQPWDLIVEDRNDRRGPQRVQVKTTTKRSPYGRFVVQISTRGGNRSWNGTAKLFDPSQVEWLFVLTDDGERYLIPSSVIAARHALNLSPALDPYRVDPQQPPLPFEAGPVEWEAWKRVRSNRGAAGVDGETLAEVEAS